MLIERREALIERLRSFALEWSRTPEKRPAAAPVHLCAEYAARLAMLPRQAASPPPKLPVPLSIPFGSPRRRRKQEELVYLALAPQLAQQQEPPQELPPPQQQSQPQPQPEPQSPTPPGPPPPLRQRHSPRAAPPTHTPVSSSVPATHKIEPPSNFHHQHKLSAAPTGFGWAASAASAVSGDVDAAQQLVAQLLSELMACTLALVEALNPLEWSAVSVEKSNTGTGAVSGTPRLPPSPSSSSTPSTLSSPSSRSQTDHQSFSSGGRSSRSGDRKGPRPVSSPRELAARKLAPLHPVLPVSPRPVSRGNSRPVSRGTAASAARSATESSAADIEVARGASGAASGAALPEHWIAWALRPPPAIVAVGPPPGLKSGVAYLLQVLLDFHRLPLPSVTDPFALLWFDETREARLLPEALHAPPTQAKLRAAGFKLRALMCPEHMRILYRAQRSPLGRNDPSWRALSTLLYGSPGGYMQRLRQIWVREQAALRMQMWLIRARMRVRMRARREARRHVAAATIQRHYRVRHDWLGAPASLFGDVSLEVRRRAEQEKREMEAALVAQRREERRLAARQALLARRRAAVKSALGPCRAFYKARRVVGDRWLTALAKRWLARSRAARTVASIGASAATHAAATRFQAAFRAQMTRARLITVQFELCARAASASAAAVNLRQPLWNALTGWRLEASQGAESASAALASLELASRAHELLLRRQHAAAVARSTLLRWYMGDGRPLTEAKLFEAVAQASAELAAAATAEASKAADPAAEPAQVAAAQVAEAAPSAAPAPAAAASSGGVLSGVLSGGRADTHSPTERSASPPPTLLGAASGAASGAAASSAAASAFAELESAMLQAERLEEHVNRMSGAAECCAKVLTALPMAFDALAGVEELLTRAADGWAASAAAGLSRLPALTHAWVQLEQLAALHRHAASLKQLALREEGVPNKEGAMSDLRCRYEEARASEHSTRIALKALEAGSRDRLAWLKATERLAQAHGALALLATLESARAEALAGARQLRVRELQAQRLGSIRAKLEACRAQGSIDEAHGARRALRALVGAESDAGRGGRVFSVRAAVFAALETALERSQRAQRELAAELTARRQAESRQRRAAASSHVRRATTSPHNKEGPNKEGPNKEGRETMLRSTVHAIQGEVDALRALMSLLPSEVERLPSSWLRLNVDELLEEAAMRQRHAEHVAKARSRELEEHELAMQAMRGATSTRFRRAARLTSQLHAFQVASGGASTAASGAGGSGDAGAGSGGGGGGAGCGIEMTLPDGGVPRRLEPEGQWERRHVHVALAHAAGALHAGATPRTVGGREALLAAVRLRPPRWLCEPSNRITPEQLLAAAQLVGVRVELSGEANKARLAGPTCLVRPEWSLLWLGLELLRAPLPIGWCDVPPALPWQLPTFVPERGPDRGPELDRGLVAGHVVDDGEPAVLAALSRALHKRPGASMPRPSSFPVDFFERGTCVTASSDIAFGGDVLHNSSATNAKARLSSNTEDYVSSPHMTALTLHVHNSNAEQVLVGIRVLLGSAHPHDIPASFSLFGRTIATHEGQRRWYDVPLTEAEAIAGHRQLTLVFSATHSGINVPVIDAVDVYAQSKAQFGYDAKLATMVERYQLMGSALVDRSKETEARVATVAAPAAAAMESVVASTAPAIVGGRSKAARWQQEINDPVGPLGPWTLREHLKCEHLKFSGGKRALDFSGVRDSDGSGDVTQSGFVTLAGFGDFVRSVGFTDATQAQIEETFQHFDVDGSGRIPYVELDKRLRQRPMVQEPPPKPSPSGASSGAALALLTTLEDTEASADAPAPAPATGAAPSATPSAAPSAAQGRHPLLPALVSELGFLRQRRRLRWRMYRPLEPVWLFSIADATDGGGRTTYVDLRTGARYDAFPSELLPAPPPVEPPVLVGGFAAVVEAERERHAAEKRAAARQARREQLASEAAHAEAATRGVRAEALRLRPRCAVELMHAARALRLDLVAQPELAFLAELALCSALPAGWELVAPAGAVGAASGAAPVRYRHVVSGTVHSSHPLEAVAAHFRV
jgi:hypothetical protein